MPLLRWIVEIVMRTSSPSSLVAAVKAAGVLQEPGH